jgi:hypothetical protein
MADSEGWERSGLDLIRSTLLVFVWRDWGKPRITSVRVVGLSRATAEYCLVACVTSTAIRQPLHRIQRVSGPFCPGLRRQSCKPTTHYIQCRGLKCIEVYLYAPIRLHVSVLSHMSKFTFLRVLCARCKPSESMFHLQNHWANSDEIWYWDLH